MIYKPFYDMNILLSDDAIGMVANIAGFLILFHLIFALFFVYRFIVPYKQTKSTIDSRGIK